MNTLTHLTQISANKKTGPIPVSTSSAETCPDSCPFREKGCYALSGPLALHWRKVTQRTSGLIWEDFCNQIAALPRNATGGRNVRQLRLVSEATGRNRRLSCTRKR